MKKLNTYENFISEFFIKNKISKEIILLSEELKKFINKIFPNLLLIDNIFYGKESKIYVLDIYAGHILQKNMEDNLDKIIGLYYNPRSKLTMYVFINKFDFMINIQKFIDNIREKYAVDMRNYITTMKEGNRYWITSDKVNFIIKELTLEKYQIFIDSIKYNL